MRSRSWLLSFLAVSSFNAVAVETQLAEIKAEVSYRDQIVNQAEQFVEKTVNVIATPFLSDKDVECLAKNIFYESGGEPLEGKVAVGMVTLNRANDPAYPNGVCNVVKQKTMLTATKIETKTEQDQGGLFERTKEITRQRTVQVSRAVCQFSWYCGKTKTPKTDDPRWIESKQVAEELARGGYDQWQDKYAEAMNFHAVYVKPGWKLKRIARVGNHIFYKGNQPVQQGG